MEEIKAGNLPISTAYELSKLNTEQQQTAFTCFVQTGNCRPAMMCSSRTHPDITVQPEVSGSAVGERTGNAADGQCVPVEHAAW